MKELSQIETPVPKEGCKHALAGDILFRYYRFPSMKLRTLIRYILLKIENGEMYSITLRRIFNAFHSVDIGFYSGGACFLPGSINPQTSVGRYCSIANTARTFNANHPQNTISSHAFFYNPNLGYAQDDLLSRTRLQIGHDVWIGHNAVVLSGVRSIGTGAIIGSNAVVSKDVPPYAVVVGYPARVVHYRFPAEIIKVLLASRWWEKPIQTLAPYIALFQQPLQGDNIV